MDHFSTAKGMREAEMLIVFSDLRGFVRFSSRVPALILFHTMSGFYELGGDIVESAGCGPVGTRSEKHFDVYGHAQFKRRRPVPSGVPKAGPETRPCFKKHTPPVRYIPVQEPHRG